MKMVLALFYVLSFVTSAVGRSYPELYTLTLVVEGVSDSKGVVGVLVFHSADGWPEQVSAALKSKAVPAHAGITEVTIPGLAAGNYAVVVLHDENENQKLDRGWLGLPTEQWGMSNNPSYGLSAPSFDRARFRLAQDERIQVTLH